MITSFAVITSLSVSIKTQRRQHMCPKNSANQKEEIKWMKNSTDI